MSIEQLESEIESRSREIFADGYPIGIGEVISMYTNGEIDLHPEFQRVYRWSARQKTDLLESIFLGIPIPSVFVSQREDGIWDVIDGVQRLSTIMEYVGIYKNEDNDLVEPFEPLAADYLPSLRGAMWSRPDGVLPDIGENEWIGLPRQRFFRQSKIDFKIVKKDSDPEAKFDLFQRLNSGTILSPQEARNCLLVMMNRRLFESLQRCISIPSFKDVTSISIRKEYESFRNELALRFFLQISYDGPDRDLPVDFGEYLTTWMKRYAKSNDNFNETTFIRVFNLLMECGGEDVFRRYDRVQQRRKGPFSNAAFEFVTTGVARNLDYWELNKALLTDRLIEFWDWDYYQNNVGAGVNARTRFPRLVVKAGDYFGEEQ
ncbi:DUF262 domain-containing protein [Tomitella fengzijianii]|uniref:DUF262 domain-containing protein n=1 Tax=Tomitella fengzijianii TaxID=2597660 RepID=UPI00131A8028|nr:DUF262 domain-containing protein [Tomitella fengzijianii]